MNSGSARLKRTITLPFLIFYGVGTMVGGGFYALLGEIAGRAGMATPIAFLLSGALALLSACSFAELSSRYPVSAGEARYMHEGFDRAWLAQVVGWLVIATGIVSASTLAVATAGFLTDRWSNLPELATTAAIVLLLGATAAWGIGQSVALVTVITVLELAALAFAFTINAPSLVDLPQRLPELVPEFAAGAGWLGLFGGAFIAFYAFIGFEDMVNVAEEVQRPKRTLPIAILVSVVLTTAIYVVVALVAVLSVSPSHLAGSATPIAVLARDAGPGATLGVWGVSVMTGINGALVQIIMASRVAYGLGKKRLAPRLFADVNPATQTPLYATTFSVAVVLILSLFFPLAALASTTSAIILVVFALVNLALWRVKKTDPDLDGVGPRFPAALPLIAFAAAVLMLAFNLWRALV